LQEVDSWHALIFIQYNQAVKNKISNIFLAPILLFLLILPNYIFAIQNKNIEVINKVKTTKKIVALTFDADMTPKMLHMLKNNEVKSWYDKNVIEELKKQKVPATLFLTGMWIEAYATTTRELSENSLFEIANHSYSHPGFTSNCYNLEDDAKVDDDYQLKKTDELLAKNTKHYSKLFRFPGLCHDSNDLEKISKYNYQIIDGDVLGDDGFQNNVGTIMNNILPKVKPGSIVVLHMMGGPNSPKTSEVLPYIIHDLKNRGYKFVTVSKLLNIGTPE
jgi:peptidoglycan/xylan/chitin deacetylase (PgdA/CDA1 family)